MQIGFVSTEKITIDAKEREWLKMTVRLPGARPQDFKITQRKKAKAGEPDYDIYMLVNGKNERFRNPRVGALWLKKSQKGDTYMSGNIVSPIFPENRIFISIVKAKPAYEGELLYWLYDVLWSESKKEVNQTAYTISGEENTTNSYTVDIEEAKGMF